MALIKAGVFYVRSTVTAMHYFGREEAIITTNEDQTLKIWLKRLNGEFWPSVSHSLQAIAKTLTVCGTTGKFSIILGLDSGGVEEFSINPDFNSIQSCDYYCAHSKSVTHISVENAHVFSLSEDGTMACRFPPPVRRVLSNQSLPSVGKCLFVDPSGMLVVGTESGVIEVFRVKLESFNLAAPIISLEGHEGRVTSLSWSREYDYLVSGDSKGEIMLWDFGGKSGITLNMSFHSSPIVLLRVTPGSNHLLSLSAVGPAGLWNMNYKRHKRGPMSKANSCFKCLSPFIWNLKMMIKNKMVGTRRHHCRNCFRSFCGACCVRKAIIPKLGYEVPVLVCSECSETLANGSNDPQMATLPLNINHLITAYLSPDASILLTYSGDHIITIWNNT